MNVLVAVDLSTVAIRVLRAARPVLLKLKARAWLVHVEMPTPEFLGLDIGPVYVRAYTAKSLRRAHARLQRMAAGLRSAGVDATALVVQGSTAAALLREADKMRADLILVGTHGHGFAKGHWMGRVVKQVLRGAKCPVVVIPSRPRE